MNAKSIVAILFLLPVFSWGQTQYTVRKGDTLLKIADRSLKNTDKNNPRRYELAKKIAQLNPDLKNPNALEMGQTIILPADLALQKRTPLKPTTPSIAETPQEKIEAPIAEQPQPAEPQAPTPPAQPTPAVAPVAPAPAPPPAQPEEHKQAHHNFIFVQPRYQMIDLYSKSTTTQTKAKMQSKSSFGLDLQYGVILNERFHLLFQGGVSSTQFSDLKDVTGTVNHKSETLKSFAAGIAYEATHSLHLDLLAFYTEHTFLLQDSPGNYLLEAVAIPGAELNVSWDFYSQGQNILGVSAIAEYLAKVKKNDVDYGSTVETFGSLYWKSNYGHDRTNYKVSLTYKQGHQETTLGKKVENITILGFGFYF